MSNDPANSRINVSEDKLRALFAEFKLDLLRELDKYASVAALGAVELRVKTLELWQAGVQGQVSARSQISRATLLWAALAVSALTAVATLVWLGHH